MDAPKAKKIPKILEIHGDKREDFYFWLNERENPEVIQYLEAENLYASEMMRDTEDFQNELYDEMKSRYQKDDSSLPYFFNEYWYIVRHEDGKEHPVFCRKHWELSAPEEIILDVNILAEGKEYFDVGSVSVSPNNQLGTFSTDENGRLIFDIKFIDISSGKIREEVIPNTTGKAVWAKDNEHIFYVKKDKSLRAYKVFRHKLGTSFKEDVLIFHEKDNTFDINLFKTKSLEYIFIASSSSTSDEHRFIPADDVFAQWKILQPRTENLEYAIEHFENSFYIITNADGATNFKLVTTEIDQTEKKFWKDLIPHRQDVLLEGFEIFKNFLVLEERKAGLLQLRVINQLTKEDYYLEFSHPTYSTFIGLNIEFDTDKLRYVYTSLTQPSTTYELNMTNRTSVVLKQQEVLGGHFQSENYHSERLWAPSRDGKRIPISLVYHKNTKKTIETPLLLYGYGSYGHTVDAGFSNVRLSLLDRGFIFAIAHVRGSEYLGRDWYEQGKMLQKKNTFFDFIDAAEYLIQQKYTSATHLYAMGGSAGGLLMGAVMNFSSDLFHGIIAQVPFVDVVTTMLDEDIPLTTGEFEEWGNPKDEVFYHYMKSYSPYDNVAKKNYPHLLITTGLHDGQVQYWEPAKWVAKLRENKTDEHLLLFKTDMDAGHSGASGRFESLKEDALEYAFLCKLEHKI